MNYEAVLFDMDGVVIDTHHAVTQFWQKHAANHGVKLSQKDFEQDIYGCPAAHTLDAFFPFLDASQRTAIFIDLDSYEANQTYQAMNGALELLKALQQHHIPVALVTSGNKAKVKEVTTQLGLDGFFSAQITVEDIQRGKPHPDGYLQAAQSLQQSPRQCIVFEDAMSGVKAATTAGALCIGVQQSDSMAAQLIKTGAWHVVPDLAGIGVQTTQHDGVTTLTLQIDATHHLYLNGATTQFLS